MFFETRIGENESPENIKINNSLCLGHFLNKIIFKKMNVSEKNERNVVVIIFKFKQVLFRSRKFKNFEFSLEKLGKFGQVVKCRPSANEKHCSYF